MKPSDLLSYAKLRTIQELSELGFVLWEADGNYKFQKSLSADRIATFALAGMGKRGLGLAPTIGLRFVEIEDICFRFQVRKKLSFVSEQKTRFHLMSTFSRNLGYTTPASSYYFLPEVFDKEEFDRLLRVTVNDLKTYGLSFLYSHMNVETIAYGLEHPQEQKNMCTLVSTSARPLIFWFAGKPKAAEACVNSTLINNPFALHKSCESLDVYGKKLLEFFRENEPLCVYDVLDRFGSEFSVGT